MPWITAILLSAILVLQYPLWLGKGCFPHLQRVEKKMVQQKQKNVELKLRNTAMEAEIQDLKRGLGSIEEHARTELGMVKPSEVLYQYLTPPTAETNMALINPSASQMLARKVKEQNKSAAGVLKPSVKVEAGKLKTDGVGGDASPHHTEAPRRPDDASKDPERHANPDERKEE